MSLPGTLTRTALQLPGTTNVYHGKVRDVYTLADGRLSVAMGVAAHRSIDERRVVEMSEIL